MEKCLNFGSAAINDPQKENNRRFEACLLILKYVDENLGFLIYTPAQIYIMYSR